MVDVAVMLTILMTKQSAAELVNQVCDIYNLIIGKIKSFVQQFRMVSNFSNPVPIKQILTKSIITKQQLTTYNIIYAQASVEYLITAVNI